MAEPITRVSLGTGRIVSVEDAPPEPARERTDPRTGEYVGRTPRLGIRAGKRATGRKVGKAPRPEYPPAFTTAGIRPTRSKDGDGDPVELAPAPKAKKK